MLQNVKYRISEGGQATYLVVSCLSSLARKRRTDTQAGGMPTSVSLSRNPNILNITQHCVFPTPAKLKSECRCDVVDVRQY